MWSGETLVSNDQPTFCARACLLWTLHMNETLPYAPFASGFSHRGGTHIVGAPVLRFPLYVTFRTL